MAAFCAKYFPERLRERLTHKDVRKKLNEENKKLEDVLFGELPKVRVGSLLYERHILVLVFCGTSVQLLTPFWK